MIPTVLGAVEATVIGSICSREVLLQKLSQATMKNIDDNPITLGKLAEVRSGGDSGPLASSNRLFSLDESVQELASLKDVPGGEGGLVLEASAASEGRDPSGLAEISRRSGLRIVMAASVKKTESTTQPLSPQSMGKDLEHQLLFGEHANQSSSPASSAGAGGTPSRIQAGFIVVKLNGKSRLDVRDGETASGTTDGRPADCIHLHSDTALALEAAVKAQQSTGAPVMLACSNFVQWPIIKAALAIATAGFSPDATAPSLKVIVAGMHGGVCQSLADQTALLNRGVMLCFDCFGRVEWSPGPDYYPSDEESAVRIAELVREGYADRMVISSGVSRRIHLSRFGGHGYGHALRTVPPRLLRLGVSTEDIALMTRGNMLRLLDWYTPPPPVEIPKNYLPCSWCKQHFEPIEGEYFHKYQFVYCKVQCLRGHRDTGFSVDKAS